MTTTLKHFIASFALIVISAFQTNAEKLHTLVEAQIHYTTGGWEELAGSDRVALPYKKHSLQIIENAYTSQQSVRAKTDPCYIDSVVVWNPTAAGYRHTMRYLPEYGWCWQLENANGIEVLAFSPKGYHVAGNGGMWTRGKWIAIVVKNGNITTFNNPGKQSDEKFRKEVAAMIPDDPVLAHKILSSSKRRDKTLRMLGLYSPPVVPQI